MKCNPISSYELLNLKNQHLYSDKFTLSVLDLTQKAIKDLAEKDATISNQAAIITEQAAEITRLKAQIANRYKE